MMQLCQLNNENVTCIHIMLDTICSIIFHPAQRCQNKSPPKTSHISFLFFVHRTTLSVDKLAYAFVMLLVSQTFHPTSKQLICFPIVSKTDHHTWSVAWFRFRFQQLHLNITKARNIKNVFILGCAYFVRNWLPLAAPTVQP